MRLPFRGACCVPAAFKVPLFWSAVEVSYGSAPADRGLLPVFKYDWPLGGWWQTTPQGKLLIKVDTKKVRGESHALVNFHN